MISYEYKCEEHGKFEELCTLEERNDPKPCPHCGTDSKRVLSMGIIKLEGLSGHFPDAASKFERIHTNKGSLREKGPSVSVPVRRNK